MIEESINYKISLYQSIYKVCKGVSCSTSIILLITNQLKFMFLIWYNSLTKSNINHSLSILVMTFNLLSQPLFLLLVPLFLQQLLLRLLLLMQLESELMTRLQHFLLVYFIFLGLSALIYKSTKLRIYKLTNLYLA